MERTSLKTLLLGMFCGVLFAVPLSVIGGFVVFALLVDFRQDLVRDGIEASPGYEAGVEPQRRSAETERRSAETERRRAEGRRQDRSPFLDQAAPDFSTSTLDGSSWRLADQRGKVVVLDFWASWCKPCIEAIPTLRDVYRRHREHPDFVMMGVSVDSERAALTRSIERHDVEWAQLYEDGEGWKMSVARLYRVRAIPHVVVIDRQGVVRAYPHARQLGAEVERLLAEPAVRGAGLEGVVLYRGAPLSKWTARDPRWSIWDDDRRAYSSGEEVDYSPATGRMEMRGVPHRGTIYVTFPSAETGGGMDDAFHASEHYDLGRSRKIELAAERVLLLHEPWDSTANRDYAAAGESDYRTFASPLRFDWEPVEDAARYRLQVIRSRDREHSEGYGYLATAVDDSLQGTTLAAHLAPSKTLEHYEFMIFAYDDSDDVVARYMVNYEGRFLSRAHPFKIAPAD